MALSTAFLTDGTLRLEETEKNNEISVLYFFIFKKNIFCITIPSDFLDLFVASRFSSIDFLFRSLRVGDFCAALEVDAVALEVDAAAALEVDAAFEVDAGFFEADEGFFGGRPRFLGDLAPSLF